jgi:MarR family transcriptional regulator for hemolysin
MSVEADEFIELLRIVPQLWREVLDRRLGPSGLSLATWRVLYHIGRRSEPVTQTELAIDLGIETPSLVRLLDRLAEDGWVERRVCSEDRRARRLYLTPRAKKTYSRIRTNGQQVREHLMREVGDEELRVCIGVLDKIRRAAEAELQPAGAES